MTTKPAPRGTSHVTVAALGAAVALAACAFSVPALADDANVIDIQLTPAGDFKPSDGREIKVPAWRINQAIATRVIERFNARVNPVVVDYEHQTLHKEANGQPAPAAAWMRALQWREGSGLWATVDLTARAAELIRNGEYKFISPVFAYDGNTGEVLAIRMAAFTNDPAIDGMEALELRAAATFGYGTHSLPVQDHSMNKLLAALCAVLGLDPANTTEDQAVAACTALKPQLESLQKIGKEVGAEEVGDGTAVLAACTALKAQASATTPDPAKYVPVKVVEDMRTEIAALTAKQTDREVNELVESGLADGRLLPAQKDWATSLGKKDIAALSGYLKTATPIAALSHSQTRGDAPPAAGADENGLTPAELAVCSATGVSPKDFAAAKAS